jgi:trimeric autotransporter adhesin
MGKFSSLFFLLALVISCVLLPACGGGKATTVTNEIPPTGVSISPSPVVSLEVGKTQTFTATPTGNTFSFQSSNTSVLTIASNGQACAGTWNSLTSPQVCTPGQPGTAIVTASSQDVSSPAVTVYVHAPVTSITISKVAGQQTVSDSCLSRGSVHGPETWLFQANAFNGSNDITATVGPFSWQKIDPAGSSEIVTLSSVANGAQGCLLGQGQCLNQQNVTAGTPGIGEIYTTVGGFTSQPISVETCRVKSISIAAAGDVPTNTQFLVTTGASTVLNATVTDVANQNITDVPLTWSPSNASSAAVIGANTGGIYGSVGTVSTPGAGTGTILGSCTPPTCNAGINPSLPIYPQAAFSFNVQAASSSTPATPTVYATTTACADPILNPTLATCTPTLVPITKASSTSTFAAGNPLVVPTTPNSLLFDHAGTNGYLGVSSNQFGQQGLMVFTGTSLSSATTVPGKVLAISPDNNLVITADTVDSPNQVFICSNCSATSRTVTSLLITGATAAAFSPDSLKAYILAGSTLYVYSKVDPLKTITLAGTANDVTFHPEGGFAYLAGPGSSITPYRNCDGFQIASSSTANPPEMIRALPNGSTLLALDPPNIEIISTTLSAPPIVLCTGTISNTITSFNLGHGSFIPTQFFLSANGATAYILGETSAGPPATRLPFVMAFNLTTQSSSTVSLANNATPLSASLSPDGTLLFVGADDGTVHVIDAGSGSDRQQVTFPFPASELCFGPGNPATQVPLSQVSISAVSQSSSNATYSYSLTSGPGLKVGQSITISDMSNGGDNGTYTIAALGTDSSGNPTFTVNNSNGVTASGQSGSGTVPISCNPDLVVVKP